ncbi:MAG: excinuclease ABC subunit UvrA [Christensenellaceae bacterium]|jgi:excinuclease ABC subunit A|nr:excinuclease ABC subunit UvrA [Christensenellaceae bacterium]
MDEKRLNDYILIKGAREHNLKNVDVSIPRDKLVVLTGLSGSGKSSLAFDTIYAEGQRRYVESLSAYARQFLGQMEKPDLDSIDGLSPAISIDQKTTSRNPRSTVGTVTEIHDYLRLLYARIGVPHCPICGREIKPQTIDQMVDRVFALPGGTRILLLAPVIRGRKGEHVKLLQDLQRDGYLRARVDGEIRELSEEIKLAKTHKHDIEAVVDRLVVGPELARKRLADSLETAAALSGGLVIVSPAESIEKSEEFVFSQNLACDHCDISMEELSPRMFSFNNPYGACPSCSGLGTLMRVDPELLVPNKSLSLNEGALRASGWNSGSDNSMVAMYLEGLSKKYGFSLNTPFAELPESVKEILFYGTKGEKIELEYVRETGSGHYTSPFEGVVTNLERRYKDTSSQAMREDIEGLMSVVPCPDCHGMRLKPISLAVTVSGRSLGEISDYPVRDLRGFFKGIELSERDGMIANQILREIDSRLGFLSDVGLEYLTLARSAGSLSGGEAQRIRLATQIGSSLMGVLYILDEPSIGLHQRDNARLLSTLKQLRDLGNTLIVVEHDEETMLAADYIVDIGPGAGEHGGYIVASGTAEEIMQNPDSLTGQYLSGKRRIETPAARRRPSGELFVRGARAHNLKNIDVEIPLGVFSCVTGVSGSGKSSLVNEIVKKALTRDLNRARMRPGAHDAIEGAQQLDKVISIDQSPIGRTPRSNPATYTGVFDLIRNIFAGSNEAKARGYSASRFSFNVKGGRCEACGGDGIVKIEMHFLPDIYVPCDVCKGKRYNRETLEVRYRGKNIFDVLDMTVEQALAFFENHSQIARKLKTLDEVGLSYIKLGQPSTQLSGGEAQRIKLATELSRTDTGRTLYILDEPTTGLHMADVEKLILMLQRLTDAGNTVLVIEHNLDVIKCADHIIDLGPEGGDMGGKLVAQGSPEEVALVEESHTGQWLKKMGLPLPGVAKAHEKRPKKGKKSEKEAEKQAR